MKYVIFSDIHANDIALQAAFSYAENLLRGQRPYQYVFLGDAVGYGTTSGALGSIRWLRAHPDVMWIPGNHDEWLAGRNNLSFQGSAELSLMVQKAYLLRTEHKDDFLWFQSQVLSKIEEQPVLAREDNGLALFFAHASVKAGAERSGYLYPWKHSLIKWDLLGLRKNYPDNPLCMFFGHTHYPLLACLHSDHPVFSSIPYGKPVPLCDGMVAINPGSIGQPRDGDPRSPFVVLDTIEKTITFYRVEYDVEEMAMRLEADGHFESRFHPLTLDELDDIKAELQKRGKPVDPQKTYGELIARVRAGNKDSNLSEYQGFYHKTENGLDVVAK